MRLSGQINVKCEPSVEKKIRKNAKKMGKSISDYVRFACLNFPIEEYGFGIEDKEDES